MDSLKSVGPHNRCDKVSSREAYKLDELPAVPRAARAHRARGGHDFAGTAHRGREVPFHLPGAEPGEHIPVHGEHLHHRPDRRRLRHQPRRRRDGVRCHQVFSSVYFSAWSNRSYFRPLLFSSVVLLLGNVLYALAYDLDSLVILLLGRLLCGYVFTDQLTSVILSFFVVELRNMFFFQLDIYTG
jgi:hypothetical protein